MARRRFIQPGYWTNSTLSKCPPLTRLLFQVIWIHADYDGCFRWDPEGLAMKGLPRDDFEPGEALDRLEHDGFVQSYQVDGSQFGFVVNWHKYQDPHPGERPACPKPLDEPTFVVKIKDNKWRKPGDTAFGSPETKGGLYSWLQLANNLPASCTEVAGKLSATDKEGQEGKEGKEGKEGQPHELVITLGRTEAPTKARSTKPAKKAENLGVYPEEVLLGREEYRSFRKAVLQPEIRDLFPEDQQFLAGGIGSTEKIAKAWARRTASLVKGEEVTNLDVLDALRQIIRSRRKAAENGNSLRVPLLETLINHDEFVDSLVKIKVVRNAS